MKLRRLIHVASWLLLGLSHGAQAASWSNWWLTREQQAQRALEAGDAKQAAQLFNDPRRRAYAELKSGQYADAAKRLASLEDAQSQYNRGNALAHTGQLQSALAAYDAALKQTQKDSALHRDAQHNRDLVAKQLQQQKQAQKNQSGQNQSGNKQGQDNQQNQGGGPSNSQSNNQRNSQANNQGKQSQQQAGQSSNNAAHRSGNDAQHPDQQQANSGKANGQSGQQAANNSQQAGQQHSAGDGKQSSAAEQAQRDAAAAMRNLQQGKAGGQQGNTDAQANQTDKQGGYAGSDALSAAASKNGKSGVSDQPPSEQRMALEQWLGQIPDDPGGLLRRKFLIEHMIKQREAQQ
jgi:Ca-activated chloride channel homolog